MVEAAVTSRDQIKDELLAMATQHIDNWDNYASREFSSSEFGFNFISRQTDHEGSILTVSKATVPGLTLENHATFRANLPDQLSKMDPKLSISECPDFEGHKCLIQHISMPMFMTNRSIVQIYYMIENEDGSLVYLVSSRGTDEVVAAQTGIIKKDVVGNNIINYMKLTPTEDGCEWVSVQCLDVAGSLPTALKKLGAKR